MFGKKELIVLLSGLLGFTAIGQERGSMIFSDNFNTPLSFAELWKPRKSDPVKSQDECLVFTGDVRMQMNRYTPEEFIVEMDLLGAPQAKSSAPGTAFGGFQIENIFFGLTPDGKCVLKYTPTGKDAAEEKFAAVDGFKADKPVALRFSRVVENGHSVYRFFANGKELFSITAALPSAVSMSAAGKTFSPLEIVTLKVGMSVDNFVLSAIKRAGESPNLIINSSFEYEEDGSPLFFTRDWGGRFRKEFYDTVPYEDYIALWTLDDKEKYSGKYSLRIVNNTKISTNSSLTAWGAGTEKGRAGVFSVYMKSDQEDYPVTLEYSNGKNNKKTVKVSKEWKRYEVVNPELAEAWNYSGPIKIRLPKDKDGILWIDDLQAEIIDGKVTDEDLKSGKAYATEYKTSERDKAYLRKEKAERVKGFNIAKLPGGVTPTVNLDTWKDMATKLDAFFEAEKIPKNRMEAYLACDDQNVYIAYRNFGENYIEPGRKPAGLFGRGATSVEIFFDPDLSRNYYQFACNSTNSRDIGAKRDTAWSGGWKREIVKNEKTGSVDYLLTFPLYDFASPRIRDAWAMNICRNDGAAGEFVSIAKSPLAGFHNWDFWPMAQMPADIVKNYRIGLASVSKTTSANENIYTVELANHTGRERSLKAECFNMTNNGEKVMEKMFSVKDGESTKITFNSKDNIHIMEIKLTENGKILANNRMQVKNFAPLKMLGRLSFYMNEPEAVFKVTSNLPDSDKMTAVLECAGEKVSMPGAASFKIALPLKDIKDGEYKPMLKMLKADGSAAATIQGNLIKRPYWKGATQVNHFTRSLINGGKPVFQLAHFIDMEWQQQDELINTFRFFKKYGFKTLHVLIPVNKEEKLKTAEKFLKLAVENDIKVMIWSSYQRCTPEQLEIAKRRLNFPNILSQMVMDEPELGSYTSDEARDYLRKMRKEFPYHPVHMNNTSMGIPNRFANLETDILMLDAYLTSAPSTSVANVVNNTDLMREAGEEEGKPCFYFIVSRNSLHYKEPSYGEQIAQSYGNIAAGCTGLSYYYEAPMSRGSWTAVTQMAKEIDVLHDMLLSEEDYIPAVSDADAKKLRFLTRVHEGYLYIVACNIDRDSIGKVTFTLPTEYRYVNSGNMISRLLFSADAEVMFEDRKIDVKDGEISDEFDGYERHVYKLRIRN